MSIGEWRQFVVTIDERGRMRRRRRWREASLFTVNELSLRAEGMIRLDIDQNGACRCGLEIEHTTIEALVTLRAVLRKHHISSLAVYNGRKLVHRLLDDAPEGAERYLTGLLEGRCRAISRFLQWQIDEAERGVPRLLTNLMRRYKAGGLATYESIQPVLWRRQSTSRYICYTVDRERGDLSIDLQNRLRDGGIGWWDRSLGRSLWNFPDRDYAAWTIATYREALVMVEPMLHQVSIELALGETRYRQDYYRLVLPVLDESGRQSLVAVMEDLKLA